MDDMMSSANTLSEVIEKQQQLHTILQSANFLNRIWCANNEDLLKNILIEDLALQLDIYKKRSGI